MEHKDRFYDDFGALNEEDAEALGVPNKKDPKAGKPADFRALFSGNNDDHFRIGLKFTRFIQVICILSLLSDWMVYLAL